MTNPELPDLDVPPDMTPEEMPDLLRFWYLGSRARRHMVLRRFHEVDAELGAPGARVLDIGSAWGYNVMALSRMGFSAVGMDLVAEQFPAGARIAAHNGIEFDVVGADAAALPFADESFDYITMVETFEHVFEADRARVIEECHRVLRPGGRLVLSTPNYDSLVERMKRILIRLPWLQRRLPSMCYPADSVERGDYHPYSYHQPLSVRRIARLLEAGGLEPRRAKYCLFVLKSTPDAVFSPFRSVERVLERTPVLRRLAATVCVSADKPLSGRR